ncbi:amino acid adenylation domain-containing protein, partial [Rheinheimera sp. WS51]|uniref:amino acid adenylation domain-containing protein n=1 Tax=Rheinheimera sp. WS51 TaxID=3425886 RepID=UPI003D916DCC
MGNEIKLTIYPTFMATSTKFADCIAISSESDSISYEKLTQRVSLFVEKLQKLGITPGSTVGLVLEKSIDYIVVYLAICRLDAIFVPIDPQAPAERTRFIIQDAGLKLLISDQPEQHCKLFKVSTTNLNGCDYLIDNEWKNLDVAGYIIYTSGSTGTPKGVLVSNAALLKHVQQISRQFSLSSSDVLLHLNSLTFDASLELLWLSLLHGCNLHLQHLQQFSVADFYRYTQKYQVTMTDIPPAYLGLLLEGDGAKAYWASTSLKTIVVGGDVLPRQIIDFWQEYHLFGRCHLLNAYGPTEAVISACYHNISAKDLQATAVAIGKVLQPRLCRVVPVDGFAAHEGELHLGGDCLAEGYINRPEQTKDVFYEDEQGRWYRTGDIVTRDASGLLRFICRRDQQVKVRGFRVEVSEIENQLNSHPAIAETAIVKHSKQDSLIAFIRPAGSLQPGWLEVRTWLSTKLPRYMLPEQGYWLKEFPLLSSGKVDRKHLLTHEMATPILVQQEYAATELETELAKIWQDILQVELVSVVHSFSELGGHSIQLTKMLGRLTQQYGVELSFAQFSECNSVRKLAKWLEQNSKKNQSILQKMPVPERFLASSGQQRMWLSNSLSSQKEINNVQSVIYFEGSLQLIALEQALTSLVYSQPQLRTRFLMDSASNQLWQETLPVPTTILQQQDWTDKTNTETVLNEYITLKSQIAFDLSNQALFAAELIHFSEKKVLILTCHHIITDGWSMDLLLEQLAHYYNQHCAGIVSELTEAPWHYANYVQWQQQWLQTDAADKQREFWSSQLLGAPSLHSLMTDYVRPQHQSYAGRQLHSALSINASDTLNKLCTELELSPFCVLQTLFTILVARFSATDDVVVGTAVANRLLPEFEDIAGFFVNSLPLRLPLSMQQSLVTTLQQARNYLLKVLDNQDLPFDDIVDLTNPERSLSYHPLFQLMFSFRDAGFNNELTLFDDVTATLAENASEEAKFDLTLEVVSGKAGFRCCWTYATDLFEEKTIQALADSYCYLLDTLAEQLNRPLAELAMIANTSCAKPSTEHFISSGIELGQHLTKVAATYADKVAIQFNSKQLTYRELDQQSSQLAHYLINKGVQPEQIVAVCTERSIATMVAILAVLKAGGAYLPIDPTYPEERIEHMLTDSDCQLVLTQQSLQAQLPTTIDTIALDHLNLANYSIDTPDIMFHSEQLAYVIFTSGSTGKPKGTLLQRGALLELGLSLREPLQITAVSRVLQFATVSFDAATFELIMAFCSGASLHICDETQRLDMLALEKKLLQEQISHAVLPPAILPHLLCRDDYSLQTLLVAGEACNEQQAWKWAERYALYNAYGPSECTIAATLGRIMPKQRITLGQVLPTVRLYVLDDALQPLPVGAVGELYIGGMAVGRGYLNRPELTEQNFINNPFIANERLYKTGDLVRLTSESDYQFIGRKDHQVKIRGYRVELAEIEACLCQQPQIKEAAVLLLQDRADQPVLVAYYVLQQANALAEYELRQILAKQLPAFMVPGYFVTVSELPRSVNGKLNRNALPLPDWQYINTEFKAASTSTEILLQQIWAEYLQLEIEQTSIDSNFFALGGHSLLAARVVSAITQQRGVQCTIRHLFDNPTIEKLSAWLDEQGQTLTSVSASSLTESSLASAAQRQMWLLCQLEQQSTAYHIPLTLDLKGVVDQNKLDWALCQLIERHAILRTVYQQQDMLTVSKLSVPKTVLKYDELPEKCDVFVWLEAEIDKMALLPFNLAADYPVRAKLLHYGLNQYQLLLCFHHIAVDGESVGLLLEELAALYNDEVLQPIAVNYAQFTSWLQQQDVSSAIEQQGHYWQQKLVDLPLLHQIATDYQRPSQQQFCGDSLRTELDASVLTSLSTLAAQQNTTVYQLLQSSFAILLARYSQQSDIVMGSPVANRTESWQQSLVGYLVNTLVVRTQVDVSRSFIAQLEQDKLQHSAMLANQQYPFEKLVEVLKPERSLSYHPLFQIMFSFRHQADRAPKFNQLISQLQDSPVGIAKFDLTLDIIQHDSSIELNWEFDTGLFNKATIGNLSQAYTALIRQIIVKPKASLATHVLAEISNQPNYKPVLI